MSKLTKIGIVSVLILLLILVRGFAPSIFYDPFIDYFKNDFLSADFPEISIPKLAFSIFFRFLANSLLSFGIIYYLFNDFSKVKFAFRLYVLAFLILCPVFIWQVSIGFSNGYLFPFYVRRLLIHPILLLVLIPAFYFQRKMD